ncbi:hypothetical protein THAOC_12788, partial [Thalassiosira oceanica]
AAPESRGRPALHDEEASQAGAASPRLAKRRPGSGWLCRSPSQDRYDVGALPKQAVREEDGRLARRCEDVKEDEAEKPLDAARLDPQARTHTPW